MLNTVCLRTIPLLQRLSPFGLEFSRRQRPHLEPFLSLRGILRHLLELSLRPRQPLIELGYVGVQHINLLFEHIVNRDDNVRPKRLRPREPVAVVEENRIPLQGRRIRYQIRHDHHVGRVLH